MKRHLGRVSIANYFDKVLWVDIIQFPDVIRYKIDFCVNELPDNFDGTKELPKFKIGDKEVRFHSYYINGGIRYSSYYKINLELENEEELKIVIDDMIKNPINGFITFKITKDLETIMNDFKISLL
jgi:hypothetical protein